MSPSEEEPDCFRLVISYQAYDGHMNMVLSDVTETITVVEPPQSAEDEPIIRVSRARSPVTQVDTFLTMQPVLLSCRPSNGIAICYSCGGTEWSW
jgi:small nuclear ribonucleoprotein (snRNP)-like protein